MSKVIVQEQGVTRTWRSIAGKPQGPSGIDGGDCGQAHQPLGFPWAHASVAGPGER